jgi:hypothetical protein
MNFKENLLIIMLVYCFYLHCYANTIGDIQLQDNRHMDILMQKINYGKLFKYIINMVIEQFNVQYII